MLALDPNELNIDYKSVTVSGQAIAVCEFHDDHSPSMMVNLVEGNFYCFSCGSYGDANKLVARTGGKQVWKDQIFSSNKATDDEWHKLLRNPLAYGDEYLESRGVPEYLIKWYDIRSNDSQIIFPLLNKNKELTGIKVRNKKAKGRAKYLTFGVMPPYITTGEFPVIGEYKDKVIITEGLFGLLRWDKFGYNVITPMSANRVEGLAKFIEVSNHDFYIAFDDDFAGYMATAKLLYLCRHCENLFAFEKAFEIDDVDDPEDLPYWSEVITCNEYNYPIEETIHNEFGKDVSTKARKSFERFKQFA